MPLSSYTCSIFLAVLCTFSPKVHSFVLFSFLFPLSFASLTYLCGLRLCCTVDVFHFLFFPGLAWSILHADSARWMRLKDTAVLLWTLARFACLLGCWLHFHPGAFSQPPTPPPPHTHLPPPPTPIDTHTTRNQGLFQTKIDGWNQSDMVLLFFLFFRHNCPLSPPPSHPFSLYIPPFFLPLSPPTPLSGLQTEEMHKFRRISIPVRLSISRQGLAPFRLSSSHLYPPSLSPFQHCFESFKRRFDCRPTYIQAVPKLFLGIMIFCSNIALFFLVHCQLYAAVVFKMRFICLCLCVCARAHTGSCVRARAPMQA